MYSYENEAGRKQRVYAVENELRESSQELTEIFRGEWPVWTKTSFCSMRGRDKTRGYLTRLNELARH
jgi:hypothetical protein